MTKIYSLMVWFMIALPLLGAVPRQIHYQGQLTDDQGTPVSMVTDIEVAVFTNESASNAVWEQSVTNVMIMDGFYEFDFGDETLAGILTNSSCWLQLTIDDVIMEPREPLLAVPYARRVDTADQLFPAVSGLPSKVVIIWSGFLDDIPEGWVLCDGQNGTPDLRERFVAGAVSTQQVEKVVGSHEFALTGSQMPEHTHSASSSSDGAHNHTASSSSAGNHSHSGSTGGAGSHSHSIGKKRSWGSKTGAASGNYPPAMTATSDNRTSTAGSHSHSVSISSAGAHTHSVTVDSAGSHSHTITLGSTGAAATIENRPPYYQLAFIMKQ